MFWMLGNNRNITVEASRHRSRFQEDEDEFVKKRTAKAENQ